MKSWNTRQSISLAAATALLVTLGASQAWAIAENTPPEVKCHATLYKNISKHTGTIMKELVACRTEQLEGGPACPDADALDDIAKSEAKAVGAIVSTCQSVCNVSGVDCIGSELCPPNGDTTEACTFGSGQGFEIESMGFPGPFCDAFAASGKMREPADFGTCAAGVSSSIGNTVVDLIFGDVTAPISDEAGKCLKAVYKTLPKSITKLAGTVAKCRDKRLAESTAIYPADGCAVLDPKIVGKLDKVRAKLAGKIAKSCTDAAVTSLSFCGAGVGGLTTVEEAQECLGDVLEEASISGELSRQYATISLINAAYPATAAPACGDNLINQLPNPFAPNGEECDGDDLGSCASCLPPGDIFECTCAETRRSRVFADGLNADLDNGWTGASHNSKTPNGAGFVSEVSGCDCTEFTGATCTGTTGDSVCDVTAQTEPQCSHRVGEGFSCDDVGNGNGINDDLDCLACSDEAVNAGDFCTGKARYCVGGANDGDRCNVASDCPGGACNGNGRCESGAFAGNGCVGPQHCGICTAGPMTGSPCNIDSHCGTGGTCAPSNTCRASSCIGGANDDAPCNEASDCPGGRCAETSDCNAQCYNAMDVPTGPCWSQEDCAEGERCRGACGENECLYTYNSAPLPLSSEGTSVCVLSRFHTNVSGTRDIVDGSHAINYELRSHVHYGGDFPNSVPCPVCGGYCATTSPPTASNGTRCFGTCSGPELACRWGQNMGDPCTTNADCGGDLCDQLACRFDDECPNDGTCSGIASAECGENPCRLDLSCSHGQTPGASCRIESYTAFGTTSSDCEPENSRDQTVNGLAISWTPLTSGTVSLESPAPCNALGFGNYDCNCVFGTVPNGITNAPNKCGPACTNPTDPNDLGRSCVEFTQCVGGSESGASCDEDSDCSGGGTCSKNPSVCGDNSVGSCSLSHCVGGESAGNVCASNAQCVNGSGIIDGTCQIETCVIGGTPCLDGECIPDSCTTNGDCTGSCDGASSNPGAECTSDPQCPGGTCLTSTCDDVCPGGMCTPLCVNRGECNGGTRDGLFCALDKDCTGGGTCDNPLDEEGACAQGSFNHCDGPGWEFQNCSPTQVDTPAGCEWGTDGPGGNSNRGAGFCRRDVTHCFINDGTTTGGGGATDAFSVATFCIPASLSPPINSTAGLPGPGRIRQPSTIVTNFDSLP